MPDNGKGIKKHVEAIISIQIDCLRPENPPDQVVLAGELEATPLTKLGTMGERSKNITEVWWWLSRQMTEM